MATEVESPPVQVDQPEVKSEEAEKPEVKSDEAEKPDENDVEEKKDETVSDGNKPDAEANAVVEGEKQEENGPTAPPKVSLYQHPPWNSIPSPLPACIKVETYCRMMKIPYENVYKAGTDQKLPYLEYQGETKKHDLVGFLNSKFEVDADANLSDKDKAFSRAFQCMAEKNTYWSLMYYRWVDNFAETKKYFKGLDVVRKNVRPKRDQSKSVKCLEAHEIGKHNKEEIYAIGEKDLRSMSAFLNAKEFFMGAEPTTIDCTMFGLLSCLLHTAENSPLAKVVNEDLKNLVDFCGRMKVNFWPDWNELCSEDQVEETRPKSRLSVKKKKRTKSQEATAEVKEGEGSGEKEGEDKKEGEGEAGENKEETPVVNVESAAESPSEEAKEQAKEAKEDEDSAEKEGKEKKEEEEEGNKEETPAVKGDPAAEAPAEEPKEQAEEGAKEEEAKESDEKTEDAVEIAEGADSPKADNAQE